jgi:hypothetical protein
MKIREFRLIDAVGMHRVQLYQKAQGESILILLDGMTIGSIDRSEDFATGHTVRLLDRSGLTIQFANNQVFAFHNGQSLQAVPSLTDVETALSGGQVSTPGKTNGYSVTGLVLGIVSDVLLFLSLKLLFSPPDTGSGAILMIVESLFAIGGIIFSSLRLKQGKTMAIWGLVLSILGIAPSALFLIILVIYALIK